MNGILDLTKEQRATIEVMRAEGLIWLVNAAVLHPRGWALAVHFDSDDPDGLPVGLSIVGDGSEPICFGLAQDGSGQADASYADFKQAESGREATWSTRLRRST